MREGGGGHGGERGGGRSKSEEGGERGSANGGWGLKLVFVFTWEWDLRCLFVVFFE